jgi:uncharacterized protein YkwD
MIYATVQAQTVPASSGSKLLPEEAQIAVDFHNRVRHDVGSPALQWSNELAGYAQAWANYLEKDCNMKHRPSSGPWAQKYGENIFWGGGEEYTALNASEDWYSEIKEYKYGPVTNKNYYKTGHYTQMVWKTTTYIGIGKAVCKNGSVLIVANYSPSGNYIGERPY